MKCHKFQLQIIFVFLKKFLVSDKDTCSEKACYQHSASLYIVFGANRSKWNNCGDYFTIFLLLLSMALQPLWALAAFSIP
jgi:hypothetical protein